MARIRTIKPEFWTDEKVGEVSVSARLLFIACWNFADDQGGLDRSAKQLKAQAFPYDVIDCEPLVIELLGAGVLIEYEVAGKKYLHIKNFRLHQKIENPSKARIPPYEGSGNNPVSLTESSPSPQPSSSGRESNGREIGAPTCTPSSSSDAKIKEEASSPPGLDPAAWSRWCDYRVKVRKPIKPVSIPAAQRELAGFGADQAAVVEQSIANSYQGLFALKNRPKRVEPAPRPPPPDAFEVARNGR